jgi:hypothetical protein
MHGDFWVRVLSESDGSFGADGSVAKRRAFGTTGNDTDVSCHRQFPSFKFRSE